MLPISEFQDFERVAISRTRCANNTGNVPAIVLTGPPQTSIPQRIGHAAFQFVTDRWLSRSYHASATPMKLVLQSLQLGTDRA